MKENYKTFSNKANDDAEKSGGGFGKSQELFGDYMLEYYLNFYKGIVWNMKKTVNKFLIFLCRILIQHRNFHNIRW